MKYTVSRLQGHIDRCMNQEKKALSLGDWNQAEWCRAAARQWRSRLEIAKKQGYWEHEYEPIGEQPWHTTKPN